MQHFLSQLVNLVHDQPVLFLRQRRQGIRCQIYQQNISNIRASYLRIRGDSLLTRLEEIE